MGQGGWLAVFGGDSADESTPDLGLLMRSVRGRCPFCRLLAVMADSRVPDAHVDAFFRYEQSSSTLLAARAH